MVTSFYDHALTASGITITQYSLLCRIGRFPDVQHTALAAAMAMERTTLTRNLDRMEKLGLVQSKAGDDRRARFWNLTPAGKTKVSETAELWSTAQKELMGRLGAPRWDELKKLLQAVGDASQP